MEVRKYKNKDFEDYRKICIVTAPGSESFSEKKKKILTLTYCEYYAECEYDVCFSLTDNDIAVGYILCAKDNKAYEKAFLKYAAKIARISPFSFVGAYGGTKIYRAFNEEYPAHLHIDILPLYQHKGYGTELMNSLKNELKKRHIKGVQLCVGADNKNAQSFYKKNDFEVLRKMPGGILMGYKVK